MKTRMKVLALILCAVMLLGALPVSAAYTGETRTVTAELTYRGITIRIGGKEIVPADTEGNIVDPFILDGSTYLPLRAVANVLGFAVSWDDDTSTVLLSTTEPISYADRSRTEKKTGTETAELKYRDIKVVLDGERLALTDTEGNTVEPFIIDGTTYLPVRAIAEALSCKVEWYDEDSRIEITRAAETVFKAGAGASPIKFDQAMFPIEGFSGEVNDDPYARVLVLENNMKVAVVSLELVNASEEAVAVVKDVISETNGVAKENIWVHQTHAITTMHGPSEQDKNELYLNSVRTAITAAAQQAAASLQPAAMGVATATLDVNANRDIEIDGEWYFGMGSDRPSNKTMTILRFDAADGSKPIGFFVSYGIKPTSIDNTQMSKDIRVISADVPGVAMTDMEAALGAPAMFVMPAAGDQIPAEVAYYYEDASRDENGVPVVVELEIPEAVELMERQGHQMGDACIELAEKITCDDDDPEIIHTATYFTFENKAGDGDVQIDVSGLQIGQDVALVGLKPEVSAVTELDLWEKSPYEHTLIVSFLNGDQKYMPEAEAYDLNTWAAKRAGGAKGTAEKFVEVAVDLLNDMREGKAAAVSADGGTSGGADATYSTVEFGGTTWFVLDKKDGKSLLLSEYVLEHRAYHDADEAITWENSTLRAYLNGEFYETTFSDAEKAQIAETENLNSSNSHYGIPGGNATKDNVFLLSLGEATQYLLGYSALLNAKDKDSGEIVWWHLRSPGEATNVAACVGANGLIDDHGVVGGVSDPEGGVRPAMWVELG